MRSAFESLELHCSPQYFSRNLKYRFQLSRDWLLYGKRTPDDQNLPVLSVTRGNVCRITQLSLQMELRWTFERNYFSYDINYCQSADQKQALSFAHRHHAIIAIEYAMIIKRSRCTRCTIWYSGLLALLVLLLLLIQKEILILLYFHH